MGLSLRQHIKIGAVSGFLVFVVLWLIAIILPGIGEPIFEQFDHFSPYTIIGWLSDLVFEPSQREAGILFVLGTWSIYTMLLGLASGVVVYYLRLMHQRRPKPFNPRNNRADGHVEGPLL